MTRAKPRFSRSKYDPPTEKKPPAEYIPLIRSLEYECLCGKRVSESLVRCPHCKRLNPDEFEHLWRKHVRKPVALEYEPDIGSELE